MKKYFVSFCDKKYYKTLQRLKQNALQFGMFDSVFCYSDIHFDADFWAKHGDYMQKTRGFGYWIWKYHFVLKTLDKMQDNDILVFADGGCTLNPNGRKRMQEYFDIVQKSPHGFLSFEIGAKEKFWSKMDLFKALNCSDDPKYTESFQMVGGVFILRKCENAIRIIQKTLETAIQDNYHLVDDSPSKEPNPVGFQQHRHDQSIFSLVRKMYGTEVIPDETYFKQFAYDAVMDGTIYPIWATRMKF